MKKNTKVVLILLSVIVVVLLTFFISRAGPKRMIVELSGTAGLRVGGLDDVEVLFDDDNGVAGVDQTL